MSIIHLWRLVMSAFSALPPPRSRGTNVQAGLEHFYFRHGSELCRHAWRYTGCKEAAEDVAHDVSKLAFCYARALLLMSSC